MIEGRVKKVLIRAVRTTGNFLLEQFEGARVKVVRRVPHDLTLEIDRLAEDMIIHTLKGKVGCEILSEESGLIRLGEPRYRLFVDPLDGTVNFFHGVPHFCVSIALEEGGRMRLGVVYDPVRRELFVTEEGVGTFLNGKRVRVSQTEKLEDCYCAYLWTLRAARQSTQIFWKLRRVRKVRNLGAAALDLCYTACGRFDAAVLLAPRPWDIAAGALAIEQAGGVVTDLKGGKWNPRMPELIAANPRLHSKMLRQLG
jgi:myo-inositol-1(or 4)-monophosphatase